MSVYSTPCLSRHAHHMCVMHTFVFTVKGSLFDVSSISAYVAVIIVHPTGRGKGGHTQVMNMQMQRLYVRTN